MTFYDMNAAIDRPNIVNSLRQGFMFGQQKREIEQQEADRNELRALAAPAASGDIAAQDRALAIDPQRGQQFMDAGAKRAQQLGGYVKWVNEARARGNPQEINARVAAGSDFIRQLTGKPGPMQWSDDPAFLQGWNQLEARVAMSGPEAGRDGKVVGNALVDPQTGAVIYQGPEIPVNAQIVQVPDGRGGTISMMFDPRTRQLSDLPTPNGGPAAPAPQRSPDPVGSGQPIGGASVDANTGQADPTIAALPPDQQQAAFRFMAMNRPFHVKNGQVIEGMSDGSGAPQPASLPPLSQWGGGDERLGYTPPKPENAPAGYRYRPDGALEPIPGGPADKPGGGSVTMLTPEEVAAAGFPKGSVIQRKPDGSLVKVHSPTERDTNGGKALPGNVVTQLTADAEKLNTLTDLAGTFSDDYAGNVVGGSMENLAGRLGGEHVGVTTQGQSSWWQNYDRYRNVIRNELFGSALTPSEQAAFEAADITPNMDPKVIRANLAKQTEVIERVLKRRAAVWEAQGYNPGAVTAATRVGPAMSAVAELSDDDIKRELGL